MSAETAAKPTMPAVLPASIESAPRLGPTERSSMIERAAGRAPDRSKSESLFTSSWLKLPVICPRPPGISERITGAEMTLLSRTMAKGLPIFSRVTRAKRCRAPRIKFEIDGAFADATRSVVVSGIGVHEVVARDDHLFMHENIAARMLLVGQENGVGRRSVRLRFFRRDGQIDKLEGQLRGRADARLHFLGRKPRHLDQNAVFAIGAALGLDGGFGRAVGIDAAANDLDGSGNRVLDPVLNARLRRLKGDDAVLALSPQGRSLRRALEPVNSEADKGCASFFRRSKAAGILSGSRRLTRTPFVAITTPEWAIFSSLSARRASV